MTQPRPRRRKRPLECFDESPLFRAIRAINQCDRAGVALPEIVAEIARHAVGTRGDGALVVDAPDVAKAILEMGEAARQRMAAQVARREQAGNGAKIERQEDTARG